ncbi:MAG: trypsin-like peptidase domain-containing protein [Longimicrobiales bacterium]
MVKKAWTMAGLLAVASSALLGCSGSEPALAQTSQSTQQEVREALGDVPIVLDTVTASQLSGAFRSAAATALPAVVQIQVQSRAEAGAAARMPFIIPGMPRDGEAPIQRGTGSGFIIDEAGHILTNNHVVEGADRIVVRLADGREYTAETVGRDPNTDVAVIKIDPAEGETLPVSRFGDSDKLKVGDWVLALGNPLGLDFTVTAGIVSAKNRSIDILRNEANTQLEAFIQTDAAINRGNSGGPMVDLLGRVVGINSAIESPTGFFTGAGFAIPINLARKVGSDLIAYGVVHRPRLGIQITEVDAADAQVYDLPLVSGAEISTPPEAGTPAAEAGLQMGDVIVSVEGDDIRTVAELQSRVARMQPGETIDVDIIRYGERLTREVRLGEFEQVALRQDRPRSNADSEMRLGFRVAPAPPEATQVVDAPGNQFVAIVEVDEAGPLAGFGVRRGEIGPVILKLNGQDVRSVADVQRIARSVESGDVVSLVYAGVGGQPTIHNYRVR